MSHGEHTFDGPSGPVQDIDGLWSVGGGGQDAAAEPGNCGAVGQESPRRRASGAAAVRMLKGSGKLEPFVPFFLELIEQDRDITLVELQAGLLAAHGVSFSTSGIDAHSCAAMATHIKRPDRPRARHARSSKSKA